MKTPHFTPEQMEQRIARFKNLKPSKRSYTMDNVGVPGEAYNYLADNEVYVMLAPEGNKRAAARPAITGDAGLEVVIVQCQPGHGPALHAHTRTNEIFVCMSGRYELMWGDKGENSVFLEPFDMFAVPKGVFRRFRNASEDPSARMMVMVQGGVEDAFNDVYFDSSVGEAIEAKWGKVVHGNFKNIGITFEGADPR